MLYTIVPIENVLNEQADPADASQFYGNSAGKDSAAHGNNRPDKIKAVVANRF